MHIGHGRQTERLLQRPRHSSGQQRWWSGPWQSEKENLKHKLEEGKNEDAESDGSAASTSSRAKARRAAKAAGALAAPVNTVPSIPTHVFVEEAERKYLVQCCTDQALLQDANYYQSLEVLLAKYAIDGQFFLKAVTDRDEAYFSRIMVKGSEHLVAGAVTGATDGSPPLAAEAAATATS